MSNKLTFLVMDNPPSVFSNCLRFPMYDQTVNCPYPGWVLEITQVLADSINASLNTIIADSAVVKEGAGGKVRGKWTGQLGEIQKGNTDTVANLYQYTSNRAKDFDYSYPVWNMQIMFVVRAKTRTLDHLIFNSFEPFPLIIWLLLLAALLLTSAQGAIIRSVEKHLGLIQKTHVLEKFWQNCQMYLYQFDDKETFILHSGHLSFVLFALLQVVIFTSLYQGMLLSSILSPIDTSPFQTTDQMVALLANKKFKMVTFTMQYETLWFFDVLQTSNETFYKNIRDALAANPIVIKDTLEEALDLVKQGRYILMTQEDFEGILNIQRTCDLIKFTQGLPTQSAYYIFPRNSSILRLWNRAIVMNYPFIRHTYERYFGANVKLVIPPICPNERFVSEALQPIDFLAFFGTFLLFFLGLICALIALVVEFCIYKCHQHAKANPNFMMATIKEIRYPKIRKWMMRFYSFKQA